VPLPRATPGGLRGGTRLRRPGAADRALLSRLPAGIIRTAAYDVDVPSCSPSDMAGTSTPY